MLIFVRIYKSYESSHDQVPIKNITYYVIDLVYFYLFLFILIMLIV